MTKRSVQAIGHVVFEDLGSFETRLREAGYGIEWHADTFDLPTAARFERWLLRLASELATSGVSPVVLRRDNGKALDVADARLLTEWPARVT